VNASGGEVVPTADYATITEHLKRTLEIETAAVNSLIDRVSDEACRAVQMMFRCKGKLVVAGTGKSAIIGQKISSTLASTGTPSIFLRLDEATHGDIGMLDTNDVLMVISNSGESPAFRSLLPFVRRLGIPIIALVGRTDSDIARRAEIVIDASVSEEACPMGLVPTASSTAALAMGDALAVALFEKRGFTPEDFALRHPGGMLGRRLRPVEEIMLTGDRIPRVRVDTSMPELILELSVKRLGVVAIEEHDGRLVGAFSNGDLGRLLQKSSDFSGLRAVDVMIRNPKTVEPHRLCEHAVHLMQEHSITALFVVDPTTRVIGIVHLHDLLRAEIV
jgi:arabinose-5-phosphate isomerase